MPRVNQTLPVLAVPAVRITWTGKVNAQTTVNTFDFIASGGAQPGTAEMDQILAVWSGATLAARQAVVSNLFTFGTLLCGCLTSSLPSTRQSAVEAGQAGTVVQPPMPIEMAAIIKKTTGIKGQHGLGRNYMPAVPVTFATPATDPNILNNGAVIAYNALITALLLPVAAGGRTWSIAVTTRPIRPNVLVTNGALITNMVPVPLLGTVRRRREGRGK